MKITKIIRVSFPRKRERKRVEFQRVRSSIMLINCRRWVPAFAGMTLLIASGVRAQTVAGDTFADGTNGAKVHVASRFVCPAKIGSFERDAAGETDPQTGADFCAYAALDGVYGTIRLVPLHGSYDARQSMANDFAEQEGAGGKRIAEKDVALSLASPGSPLTVYTCTYETAKLEDLHYRVQFAGAAIGNWAVETTIEFAEPRDLAEAQGFLRAVYGAAQNEIAPAP
jgi:hypothetical protein